MDRLPITFTDGFFKSNGSFGTILQGQPTFDIAMQTRPDNVNVQEYIQGTKVDAFSRKLIMPLPYQLMMARPVSVLVARRDEPKQPYPYTILIDSNPKLEKVSKRLEGVTQEVPDFTVDISWNHAKPDTLQIGIPLAVAAFPFQLFQLSFNYNPDIRLVEAGAALARNRTITDGLGNTYLTGAERIFCPVRGNVKGMAPVPFAGRSSKIVDLDERRKQRTPNLSR